MRLAQSFLKDHAQHPRFLEAGLCFVGRFKLTVCPSNISDSWQFYLLDQFFRLALATIIVGRCVTGIDSAIRLVKENTRFCICSYVHTLRLRFVRVFHIAGLPCFSAWTHAQVTAYHTCHADGVP